MVVILCTVLRIKRAFGGMRLSDILQCHQAKAETEPALSQSCLNSLRYVPTLLVPYRTVQNNASSCIYHKLRMPFSSPLTHTNNVR